MAPQKQVLAISAIEVVGHAKAEAFEPLIPHPHLRLHRWGKKGRKFNELRGPIYCSVKVTKLMSLVEWTG